MPLRCRPRAGGEPYAAAKAMWQGQRQPKPWWLWVPACAGTTAAVFVPRTLKLPAFAGMSGDWFNGGANPNSSRSRDHLACLICERTIEPATQLCAAGRLGLGQAFARSPTRKNVLVAP